MLSLLSSRLLSATEERVFLKKNETQEPCAYPPRLSVPEHSVATMLCVVWLITVVKYSPSTIDQVNVFTAYTQ